jgi:hypothetical protein
MPSTTGTRCIALTKIGHEPRERTLYDKPHRRWRGETDARTSASADRTRSPPASATATVGLQALLAGQPPRRPLPAEPRAREAATPTRPHSTLASSAARRRSALRQKLPTRGDHRLGPLVDGLNGLRVVDSAEVAGCDREVGVLALDHDQRDPLTGHLHRMRIAKLVFVPTSAQTPLSRRHRYAELSEKFLLRAVNGRNMLAYPRASTTCISASGGAVRAGLLTSERVRAVDRRPLLVMSAFSYTRRLARCLT